MRLIRLIVLALAALPLVPAPAATQERGTAVRGESPRTEIERILNADNVDSSRLNPREVADTIATIERGEAPDDFWEAYQVHVRAWERFADAYDQVQGQAGSTFIDGLDELQAAEDDIDVTFDEVERIARSYGARLPAPPVDTQSIT